MFNNYNNTGAQMLGSIKIILKSLFGCESIKILPYMWRLFITKINNSQLVYL